MRSRKGNKNDQKKELKQECKRIQWPTTRKKWNHLRKSDINLIKTADQKENKTKSRVTTPGGGDGSVVRVFALQAQGAGVQSPVLQNK